MCLEQNFCIICLVSNLYFFIHKLIFNRYFCNPAGRGGNLFPNRVNYVNGVNMKLLVLLELT